jgi:glycosyltransferase involved in cell wall biosynthesis
MVGTFEHARDNTSLSPRNHSDRPGQSEIMSYTLSVIIPVFNGGEAFRECVERLNETVPQPYEVVVVVDGVSDDSWQVAKDGGLKVIQLPTQCGPAVARNVGAKYASGDILVFIDADVGIEPDFFAQIQAAFQANPTMTALIGSYDDKPGKGNFLSQYRNLFHHYVHQTAREEAFTFWGACSAIFREVFLELGGFDETYFKPCIEDIELGYRLRRQGYTIKLHKDIQVKHLKYWGLKSMLKTDFFQRALPWTELLLQEGKMTNDLNLSLASRLSVVFLYSALASVVGAIWNPWLLGVAFLCSALLFLLNLPVYQFFRTKRGKWFMFKVIPYHWLYYGYSGLAFCVGLVNHWLSTKLQLAGLSMLRAKIQKEAQRSPEVVSVKVKR